MTDDIGTKKGQWPGPWPRYMYPQHPQVKSFLERETFPDRKKYVLADAVAEHEEKSATDESYCRELERKLEIERQWVKDLQLVVSLLVRNLPEYDHD